MPNPANVRTINTATATGVGSPMEVPPNLLRSFQHTLTTTSGSGSATVAIEVSADGTNYVTLGTTTFSSAACPQMDGFVSQSPWPLVRANVTAIAGTGAQVVTTLVLA